MKGQGKIGIRNSQAGAALLIAIFALLLISVVGIALLVSSSSSTALAGNYRTATAAYYASLAGLEEGRGRLLSRNPNFIGSAFVPAPGGPPLAAPNVLYIINPAGGETVDPANTSNIYYDNEYGNEFYWQLSGATVQPYVQSASPMPSLGLPGPSFKWVRINPVTEDALKVHVSNDQTYDRNTPLFYNGTGLNLTSSGNQALEITAYAVLPTGSTKMLQYIVAPVSLNLNFPAAVTLLGSPGNNVQFTGPGTPGFIVNGNDSFAVGNCVPGSTSVYALGYAGGSDNSNITAAPAGNYQGIGGSSTVASELSVPSSYLPASFQNPVALNNLVQAIQQNADAVLAPDPGQTAVHGDDLPSAMTLSNPMSIVVNGDLDLTNWHGIGYGLLLVTGTFTYDPDATWNGIVLVIGEGRFVSTKSGAHQFNGAMLLAKTLNGGTQLSAFGVASFSQTGGSPSGDGIYYSSCWVKAAQTPTSYQVLSFHETSP